MSGGSGPDGGADTASAETPDSVLAESRLDIRRAFDAIDRWQLNSESLCDILPGLTRTYREGRDAWLFALREPTDEHFHELRKWTKYLWYHSRILERANKKKLRPRRVLLHDLEKLLGHAHDLAVLQSTLESRAWLHRSMLGQIDEQKRRLYPEALEMSRRLYAASPDRLAADLARWWEVWRRQ